MPGPAVHRLFRPEPLALWNKSWLITRAYVRASRITLAVLLVSLLALACFYVPRLTNCIWSDAEFTGWVSPIAWRMLSGERIYQDFTLPIPPGSFLLLAGLQKLLGRFLLLDELWVCAIANLAMTAIGYWMLRAFTHGRNAVLAAALTAPALILTPKEIAYDQTAQVIAWGAVALLAHGLVAVSQPRKLWLLRAAGFTACLTLAFKSSTGMGVSGGIIIGLLLQSVIAWRGKRLAGVRAMQPSWLAVLAGMGAGLAATALIVIAAGGTLQEFYRVVFVDGPALKGGTARMILNLISYTAFQTPVHLSLLMAVILAWLLARLIGRGDALLVDSEAPPADDPGERGRKGLIFGASASSAIVLVLGFAMLLFATGAPVIPKAVRFVAGFAAVPPILGLLFLAVFMVSNARASEDPFDRRAAFASVAIAAGLESLMHNLSHPTHRPFYDNNALIPMSFLALMLLLDRAQAPRLKAFLFGLAMLGLYGDKFQRFLDARHPVADKSFWYGLRVSDPGLDVLRAAQRARELAGPNGTVLMLPEDPATEALIGRPRPKLKGAIVFVDQFPARVLQHDLAVLAASPPDVLVLHPNDGLWNRVYRTWSTKSAAATLQNEFLERYRSSHYRSDSTYSTWFFQTPTTLEVLVKN